MKAAQADVQAEGCAAETGESRARPQTTVVASNGAADDDLSYLRDQ